VVTRGSLCVAGHTFWNGASGQMPPAAVPAKHRLTPNTEPNGSLPDVNTVTASQHCLKMLPPSRPYSKLPTSAFRFAITAALSLSIFINLSLSLSLSFQSVSILVPPVIRHFSSISVMKYGCAPSPSSCVALSKSVPPRLFFDVPRSPVNWAPLSALAVGPRVCCPAQFSALHSCFKLWSARD